MHRCFLSSDVDKTNYQIGDRIEIDGDEAIHISRVLRLKSNDIFEMCNNTDNTYVCRIVEVCKKNIVCEIVNSYREYSEALKKIYVFQSLSKGTKMDLVIQKSVELGAHMLIPVSTEFSVVKINDNENKLSRWKKISVEAAKQCKRNIVMDVHEPVSFKEAVDLLSDLDLSLIAYEGEKDNALKNALTDIHKSGINNIGMMIGPEGGFSETEIAYAKERNIMTVTLGKRILRTETAAIALLSAIMYEANELG